MKLFKCKHKFKYLHVKDEKVLIKPSGDNHNIKTFQLYCRNCNKDLPLNFATLTATALKQIGV